MFAPQQGSNTPRRAVAEASNLVLGIDPGLTRCGFALVRPDVAEPDTEVVVRVRDSDIPARVVARPFVKR